MRYPCCGQMTSTPHTVSQTAKVRCDTETTGPFDRPARLPTDLGSTHLRLPLQQFMPSTSPSSGREVRGRVRTRDLGAATPPIHPGRSRLAFRADSPDERRIAAGGPPRDNFTRARILASGRFVWIVELANAPQLANAQAVLRASVRVRPRAVRGSARGDARAPGGAAEARTPILCDCERPRPIDRNAETFAAARPGGRA